MRKREFRGDSLFILDLVIYKMLCWLEDSVDGLCGISFKEILTFRLVISIHN